jgi:hypothetical protein
MQFADLGKAVFEGCQKIFKTTGPVILPLVGHRSMGSGDR